MGAESAMEASNVRPSLQAITDQIERGDVNFSILRVVTDAAVVAVRKPARVFVPILAASNLLRTITLALDITAQSNVLTNLHWVASEPLLHLAHV